jgi:hypothetical protein
VKTTTLYRPVGKVELLLIEGLEFKAFPPRLDWQPIFYPVLNQAYAEKIALDWNTKDEFSGYVGIVLEFEVNADYASRFNVENVGDANHNELWVPSEELDEFNANIVGEIKVVNAFFGEGFKTEEIPLMTTLYKKWN